MIILASKSSSRIAMLEAAGIDFRAVPADIDERALESSLKNAGSQNSAPKNASPGDVALALAQAKALAVSYLHPGELVLGSDSLVSVAGRRFDKPSSLEVAAQHLRFFSGKQMELHSGAALARDGAIVWSIADCATLKVRGLSEAFIADYLAAEWPAVSFCVGVFRIEGLGVQLFDSIQGSQFTILGMPLLPVLSALRDAGALCA